MRIASLDGNFSSLMTCQTNRRANGLDVAAAGWETLDISCRETPAYFPSSFKCNTGTLNNEHTHTLTHRDRRKSVLD